MSIQRKCTVCVLAGLMLAMCGCGKPTIIGSDAAVYSGGKLHAVAGQDLNSVYLATQKALKQLELEIVEQAKDIFIAKIVAKAAAAKRTGHELSTSRYNKTLGPVPVSNKSAIKLCFEYKGQRHNR
jgi:hypothetical protein